MMPRLLLRWISLSAGAGVAGLVALSMIMVADVLMRWLLGAPVHGASDLYALLIVCAVPACIPVVILEQKNIAVRLVGAWLGPGFSRMAEGLAQFAVLIFLAVTVWQCARHALHVSSRVTPILEIPVAPVWWIACVLLSSAVPAQWLVIARRAPKSKGVA